VDGEGDEEFDRVAVLRANRDRAVVIPLFDGPDRPPVDVVARLPGVDAVVFHGLSALPASANGSSTSSTSALNGQSRRAASGSRAALEGVLSCWPAK
jgi:hypothetical protein